MTGLEWYPADWVDESCPPPKSAPLGFAFFSEPGQCWMLGYAPDDDSVLEEDRQIWNDQLDVGDVVAFVSCERLGDVEVTFRRDGSFDLHGPIPRGHNVVIANGDSDLLYASFEDLVEAIKCPTDEWTNPHDLIFEDGSDAARVELSFATWSDPIPHLFEVEDGKPVFRPVPPQTN